MLARLSFVNDLGIGGTSKDARGVTILSNDILDRLAGELFADLTSTTFPKSLWGRFPFFNNKELFLGEVPACAFFSVAFCKTDRTDDDFRGLEDEIELAAVESSSSKVLSSFLIVRLLGEGDLEADIHVFRAKDAKDPDSFFDLFGVTIAGGSNIGFTGIEGIEGIFRSGEVFDRWSHDLGRTKDFLLPSLSIFGDSSSTSAVLPLPSPSPPWFSLAPFVTVFLDSCVEGVV